MNPIFHVGTICLTGRIVSMCDQNIKPALINEKYTDTFFCNFRVFGAQGKKLENLKKEIVELTI